MHNNDAALPEYGTGSGFQFIESKRDDDAKDKSGDDELELLNGKRFSVWSFKVVSLIQ